MTIADSLRSSGRYLISTFGNTGTLYSYSSATKTENSEGDITVSDWKTGSSINVVDGVRPISEALTQMGAGIESVGNDDKWVRDDSGVAVNDRITINSIEYRIVEIMPIMAQDVLVVQAIKVERVNQTSAW